MSSDVAPGVTRSFASVNDIHFSSSAGLQELLAVVRATPMSRADYNELRDLIFTYKHTGDAPEAKQRILEQLHTLGVLRQAPETTAEEPAPSPTQTPPSEPTDDAVNKVPVRIETPSTTTAQVAEHHAPAASPSAVEPTRMRTGSVRPQPTFGAVPQTHQPPKTTSVAPAPQEPAAVTPANAEVTPTIPTAENSSADNEPVPQASVPLPAAPEPVSVVPEVTYADPLERIKAIKKEVNASVGNPVNLIDADNEIGREYMNALLDAMKKVNGGQAGEVSAAMQRLEVAFIAVKSMGSLKPTAEAEAMSASTTETPETKTSLREPVLDVTAEPTAQSATTPKAGLPKSALFSSAAETTFEPVEAAPATPAAIEPASPSVSGYDAVTASTPTQPLSGGTFASVASQTGELSAQVENAMEELKAMKQKREAEIAQMDPLLVPDVTNGLNQLLSEWKLFKSSGIFGTGPSGADHPLYKKIANLQMSAVIAGRFEGATPEIKQSITDYMNGWRYEEGILHQHGETFEHYLRRVIKKIIDKREPTAAN